MSELTRSEWLVRRRSGIGGSDVAGILGLSKWRTPRDIWLSKIDTSVEIDDQPTVQQMIGTALEPHVLRLYAEQTGRSVRRSHQLLRDADDPVLIANLDARTAGRLIEIKTARNDDEWGEPGSEDVPQEYWLQVQHYMHVARVAWCDVAVMFLDKSAPDVHVYEVPRSSAYREIANDLSKWWTDHVEANTEPAPITSADCGRRWPKSFDREAIATTEALNAIAELRSLKVELKELEQRKDDLETVVKTVMQDAERLHQSGQVLATWKTSSSSRVDLRRLRAEYPEAAAACAVETTSRRFLLKGEK
jgi:putative phage-type endonuclease